MSRETLIAVGGGALSAVVALAFLTESPVALLLVYLASLPLFLVGLSLGATAGTVAGAVGLLATGLIGGVMAAALYGLVHALPACLAIRQALLRKASFGGGAAWYPAGFVLSWLAALGVAVVVGLAVAAWAMDEEIMAAISTHLNRALTAMAPRLAEAGRRDLVAMLIPMFPGAAGASWVLMTAVNGTLAQTILVRSHRNLRPTPALADLELPGWMSWLIVGCAAVALLGPGEMEYIGRNLVMIAAVPFFFLGLAVVHALAGRVSFPGTLLVGFYAVIVFSPWAAAAVAGVGVVEEWVGLRRRWWGPRAGREGE